MIDQWELLFNVIKDIKQVKKEIKDLHLALKMIDNNQWKRAAELLSIQVS